MSRGGVIPPQLNMSDSLGIPRRGAHHSAHGQARRRRGRAPPALHAAAAASSSGGSGAGSGEAEEKALAKAAKAEEKRQRKAGLRRLLKYARPELGRMTVAFMALLGSSGKRNHSTERAITVSYTHLTLPTIYSV